MFSSIYYMTVSIHIQYSRIHKKLCNYWVCFNSKILSEEFTNKLERSSKFNFHKNVNWCKKTLTLDKDSLNFDRNIFNLYHWHIILIKIFINELIFLNHILVNISHPSLWLTWYDTFNFYQDCYDYEKFYCTHIFNLFSWNIHKGTIHFDF